MARILVVSWNFPPAVGGIESLVAGICRALGERHEVAVLTRSIAGAAPDPRVRRVGASLALFLPRAAAAAARARADLLLAGSAVVASATAAASATTGVPAAALCHGLDLIYPNRLYQTVLRASLPRHRAVVANSAHTRELARRAGVDPARVAVIPPGGSLEILGLAEAAPPPEETKARHGHPGRPWLLSVGRVIRRKGLHRFVRGILPRVVREVPDALLVVAGDDVGAGLVHRQGELALVRAAVEELGLGGNVHFAGRVGDRELAALYRAADLFVFPGRDVPGDVEGFGMVVVEAAAAGTPAVVTACGGVPDTVEDGVTGVVVAPEDEAGFAAAVVSLLRDPGRRAALGAAARERVGREYTQAALARRWLALVDGLLRPAPGPQNS